MDATDIQRAAAYEPPVAKKSWDTSRRFTDEEVWQMRRHVRAGIVTMADLARVHNVSKPCIASAVQGTGTYEGV